MSKLPYFVRLMITIDITTLVLTVLIGGIGWLMGWRTATQFSNGFFVVGAICAVVGAYSALGGFGMRANAGINIARTASPASLEERNRLMFADLRQGNNMMILFVAAGALLIGIAMLIPIIFG